MSHPTTSNAESIPRAVTLSHRETHNALRRNELDLILMPFGFGPCNTPYMHNPLPGEGLRCPYSCLKAAKGGMFRKVVNINQGVRKHSTSRQRGADYACNTLAIVFVEILCVPLIEHKGRMGPSVHRRLRFPVLLPQLQ